MPAKILSAVVILCLTGCIAIPRIETPEPLAFDYELPSQAPMSYNDLLCCYQCSA